MRVLGVDSWEYKFPLLNDGVCVMCGIVLKCEVAAFEDARQLLPVLRFTYMV
jgi:hypothetical protein